MPAVVILVPVGARPGRLGPSGLIVRSPTATRPDQPDRRGRRKAGPGPRTHAVPTAVTRAGVARPDAVDNRLGGTAVRQAAKPALTATRVLAAGTT
jgi:hypothetical protein